MNKLKEFRTQAGMKQKDLAEKLGTTQQTIARWEGGQTEIPAAHLKDIAVFFGRRVDDLLGIQRWPHQRKAASLAQADHGVLFGTLRLNFAFGSREYPIDEDEHRALLETLHHARRFDLRGHFPWFEFLALDNKLVFLNLASVKGFRLISDDTEGAPLHVSAETYRNLTAHTPIDEVGPLVAKERQQLIERLAPREADPMKALLIAQTEVSTLRVIFSDGKVEEFQLSNATSTNIVILRDNLTEVGRNAFLAVDEQGKEFEFINLTNVAAIEVPLEAFLSHLADDLDDDDVAKVQEDK